LIANLDKAIEACADINANWVCLGSGTASVTPANVRFQKAGDRLPFAVFETIETSSDGVILMNLHLESQADPVTIVMFGGIQITPDVKSPHFFRIRIGDNNQLICENIAPGMVVRTEEGATGRVTVNGVVIDLK